jgi:hypothetical protein
MNSANEIIPGHLMLDKIADAVSWRLMAGGTPLRSRRSGSATASP